jgi:hypothetical protein
MPHSDSHPRATLVMTARERHSLAEAAIDSVIAETRGAYRFIYVDVDSPAWLREVLAARESERRLEVVTFDEALWPQEARARVVDAIDTEYVVFIDNDVQVEDGWLDALIACADETGAGAVGPLYLWGDGVHAPRIHMAGGRLTESADGSRRVLQEAHQLADTDPRAVAHTLARQPCDFLEYHCMLVRTDLARSGVLDPRIRCVHEHIDTALALRQRGYPTFLEPAARVTYLAFAEYMLEDLALVRCRWSQHEADASIAAFCEKWNVLDDDRSFGDVRHFVRMHAAQIDPVRPACLSRADHGAPMRRDEVRHTRSDLLDLAAERGYGRDDLALMANAYYIAHVLMDGGYRPCGRPFIDHLVGTASVLVRYDFRADIVAAGVLHAAYTHSPPHAGGPEAAVAAISAGLGGPGSALDARVRAYAQRESARRQAAEPPMDTVSMDDAAILAVAAANEVEMHQSGEFRYSGRTDGVGPEVTARMAQVCEALGVPGLSDTLVQAQQGAATVPPDLLTRTRISYRIAPDKRTVVPMANNVLAALDRVTTRPL